MTASAIVSARAWRALPLLAAVPLALAAGAGDAAPGASAYDPPQSAAPQEGAELIGREVLSAEG